MYLKFERETTVSSEFSGLIKTSKLISNAFSPFCCKYGNGSGDCSGPYVLKGSKASMVTIQGEIDEAKFFAKKGPSGTYSHF